jgi:hypothetical protein
VQRTWDAFGGRAATDPQILNLRFRLLPSLKSGVLSAIVAKIIELKLSGKLLDPGLLRFIDTARMWGAPPTVRPWLLGVFTAAAVMESVEAS